jgi:hypothetical protein
MLQKERHKAVGDSLFPNPASDLSSDVVQTFTVRSDSNLTVRLLHEALLDSNALRQIARLIHIASPPDGDMIRK